ncbi:flagellar hook-associated protein FlgK [Dickeya dianthicola]|uniref:Flagellar hook-associated protein 1 n=1 Tax=Dickeya dianthicola TaxID=204039 RepID=A0AAP6S0Z6_9GAMM|nr:flagellar hook-associated protein FlgK [Dickeya dianthicola]ATO33733.1 Flagellar hook-associated protein FlgK [Dickeya dianthicola RNS04.9]MBT1428649.1 flagellar hook-associated protein FlgK [Dickeya dianthicola]MBT1432719.1 flagellar hook-associated protein FlgK [Dickeya dianthicola]MBT1460166.1 flagellar hook-associated protein FlgK [Dickeya dianthicola]MBT1489365.1 flagellar hook-associated protein FlgK [Dickeya dianthicola]
MSNLINTGMSGLSAAQAALSTVSNNISNQAVTGYSRQNALLAQNNGTNISAGYIGNGVTVVSINRDYNDFVAKQLRSAQTTSSSTTSYYDQISKIDNLLSSSSSSLSTTIQDFFKNLQNLTSNSSDSSVRQTVLGKAGALVNQFKITDQYLRDMDSNISGEISITVTQINTYAKQIADINDQIVRLKGANNGASPNDLLDQRDNLVNDLNKLVGVDVAVQDGDVYNISLKNGLNLVQGKSYNTLIATPSSTDPARTTVSYNDAIAGASEVKESTITGGSLGGLLSFRSSTLDSARNQLGQMALAFTDAFNQQHKAGFDLNNAQGEDFFGVGSSVTLKSAKNTSATELTSSYLSDTYSLQYNGASWNVTRSDGTAASSTLSGSALSFDGFTIDISGSAASGDTFNFKVSPGQSSISQTAPTGSTSAASLARNDTNYIKASDYSVKFVGPSASDWSITRSSDGADLSSSATYTAASGSTPASLIFDGMKLDIAGTPAAKDLFTVKGVRDVVVDMSVKVTDSSKIAAAGASLTSAGGGVSDNTNAKALLNLQTVKVVENKSSISQAYASLVGDIGNKTSTAKVTDTSQKNVVSQLTTEQQSVSGVNLDEEYGDLVRFQQYYMANAKVIQTASTIFDALLAIRS